MLPPTTLPLASLLLILPFATPYPTSSSPPLTAQPANDQFPIVRTLGSIDATGAPSTSIEGVSTDRSGSFYCVTSSSFISLTTSQTLFYDATRFLAGSRWTRSGSYYLADAGKHEVLSTCSGTPVPVVKWGSNTGWIQPNDLTSSNDGSRWYFSGMNYTLGTGELYYYVPGQEAPKKVPIDIGRTNGIELSPDNKRLLITGAKNSEGKVVGAGIWSYPLDEAGVPVVKGDEKPLFDIYESLGEVIKKEDGQPDPDGMRVDVMGNLYATLNAFGRIAVVPIDKPKEFKVVELPSVAFPTNLEMGGEDGKTLIVVGRCKEEYVKKGWPACVDMVKVPYPGRAWSALNGKL